MSVFSIIKKSRQSAKEHKQTEAEKARKEEEKTPYRHVPTHAASDALANAPPSWKNDDRLKILEHNRRRSAMAASGMNMRIPGPPGVPGLPRVSSGLSQVAYPSAHANPAGSLPRAYSYTGVPQIPPWAERANGIVYSAPETAATSLKGKEVERFPAFDSGRASQASSKGSPGSSGDSNSSQDDLEMRPAFHRHSTMPAASAGLSPLYQTPVSRPAAHRLHPSSRRTSDASERGDPAAHARNLAIPPMPQDRRPPASMVTRGYGPMPAGVLPLPSHLPGPLTIAESIAGSASTAKTTQQNISHEQQSSVLGSFNFGTDSSAPSTVPTSAATSAPTSTKSSLSTPTTPAASSILEVEASCEEATATTTGAEAMAPAAAVATPAPSALPAPAAAPTTVNAAPHPVETAMLRPQLRDRRVSKSKMTRFTELETIDSNIEQPTTQQGARQEAAASRQFFRETRRMPEPIPTPEPAPVASAPAKTGRRLTKPQPMGGKLTKKNRWSMRGQESGVVA